MTKHTPGPWKTNHDGAFIYVEYPTLKTGVICSTARASDNDYTPSYSTVNESERVPNEHLIAAAPETAAERDRLKALCGEMLDALRKSNRALSTLADCTTGRDMSQRTFEYLLEKNNDVIAKAEGDLP